MGGKGAILLVLGFSLILMVASANFGSLSTRSVENFGDYYYQTVTHNIAVSGANMAANSFFINQTQPDYSNVTSFEGGIVKTALKTIDPIRNLKEITSVGEFQGVTSTVVARLEPSKFSKFAYYSRYEPSNIWWTDNDTVWGPFHTQGNLQAYRHPVFHGKVTIKNKVKYYTNKTKDKPRFYGGFEQGVDLPLPPSGISDLKAAAAANGATFSGKDTVFVTFVQDSIKYKFAANDAYTTVLGSAFAPNGVIFADQAILRLKGTVKGRYSVVADGPIGSSSRGNIFLDDDIVYNTDPQIDPTSPVLLGIISRNDVWMTDNAPNHSDINIHGSIYAEKGGFGAENYNTRPPSGTINLLGGIIQDTRRAVGTFSSGSITHGFAKRYMYDKRLMLASPPFYPGTGQFEVVSWYE